MSKPVGVYYLNQPSETEPDHFIDLAEARRLKKQNAAFFIDHGRAIRLLKRVFCPPVAEEKTNSGWNVVGQTERFKKHRGATNAWGPGHPVWQLCR